MSITASSAAEIGAAIRRMMRDPAWSWRHGDTAALPAIERAAAHRLRDDAARAHRWLSTWSAAIGMPLPISHGNSAMWNRMAVIDQQGHVGLMDIAMGRCAWTDSIAPRYVRRFALAATRAQSAHECGGSGGQGDRAVSQVVIGCGAASQVRISPLPRPTVSEIEWGMTTCYGTVGDAPSASEYRDEWAALVAAGVHGRETSAPQWESVQPPGLHCSLEIAQAVVIAMPYSRGAIEVREGGRHHAGCRGEAEWRVRGDRASRASLREALLAAHAVVAARHIRHATLAAMDAAGVHMTSGERREYLDVPRPIKVFQA